MDTSGLRQRRQPEHTPQAAHYGTQDDNPARASSKRKQPEPISSPLLSPIISSSAPSRTPIVGFRTPEGGSPGDSENHSPDTGVGSPSLLPKSAGPRLGGEPFGPDRRSGQVGPSKMPLSAVRPLPRSHTKSASWTTSPSSERPNTKFTLPQTPLTGGVARKSVLKYSQARWINETPLRSSMKRRPTGTPMSARRVIPPTTGRRPKIQAVGTNDDTLLRLSLYNAVGFAALLVIGVVLYFNYVLLRTYATPLCWAVLCSIALRTWKNSVVQTMTGWIDDEKSSLTANVVGAPFSFAMSKLQEMNGEIMHVMEHWRALGSVRRANKYLTFRGTVVLILVISVTTPVLRMYGWVGTEHIYMLLSFVSVFLLVKWGPKVLTLASRYGRARGESFNSSVRKLRSFSMASQGGPSAPTSPTMRSMGDPGSPTSFKLTKSEQNLLEALPNSDRKLFLSEVSDVTGDGWRDDDESDEDQDLERVEVPSAVYFTWLFRGYGLYFSWQVIQYWGFTFTITVTFTLVGVMYFLHGIARLLRPALKRRFNQILKPSSRILAMSAVQFVHNAFTSTRGSIRKVARAVIRNNLHSIAAAFVVTFVILMTVTFSGVFVYNVSVEAKRAFRDVYVAVDTKVISNPEIATWLEETGLRDEMVTLLRHAKDMVESKSSEIFGDPEIFANIFQSRGNSTMSHVGMFNTTESNKIQPRIFPYTYMLLKGKFSMGVFTNATNELYENAMSLGGDMMQSFDLWNYVKRGAEFGKKMTSSFLFTSRSIFQIAFASVASTLMMVVDFGLSMFVFITSMFYLLSSKRDTLELVAEMLPMTEDNIQTVTDALSSSVKDVFVSTLKMATFHGLFTWLTFSMFDVEYIYISSYLSALSSVIPFFSAWWIAIPPAVHLFVRGNSFLGPFLLLLHYGVTWTADSAIYQGVKNSHPFMVGVSIILGLYEWNLPGVLLGPMLVCIPVICRSIYVSFMRRERAEASRAAMSEAAFGL